MASEIGIKPLANHLELFASFGPERELNPNHFSLPCEVSGDNE
jgi:hypothetical protein